MELSIKIVTGKDGIYNFLEITFVYNDIEYWWTKDTRVSAYGLLAQIKDEVNSLLHLVTREDELIKLLPELMMKKEV